ncbi:MAG: hypothetical protein D6749_11805 [Chloroflexota bacterium]|nr:MAG: hypothetical protein D6749_11805 [Chloroflexota bacterium]
MMISAITSGYFGSIVWVIFISVVLGVLFGIMNAISHSFNAPSLTSIVQEQLQPAESEARPMPAAPRPSIAIEDDDDEALLRPRVNPRQVAQRALERAGNRPSDWLLSLEDIGLLAYHGDDTPDVVRLNPVPMDTTHLRPFAVIRIPYKQGRGTIRFELIDELGTLRFVSSEQYRLTEGQNFITSRTYLRLPNDRTEGTWALRLSIGDKLLAQHEFLVRSRAQAATPVRNVLAEDGEVDAWLARAILEQGTRGSGMSLDELLSGQPEEPTSNARLR